MLFLKKSNKTYTKLSQKRALLLLPSQKGFLCQNITRIGNIYIYIYIYICIYVYRYINILMHYRFYIE